MRIPLPTDYTVHRFIVPSLGVEKRFRPFTVKENKALLNAQSVDDPDVMIDTLKQVISNCSLDDLDVDQLALFDAEYLFIKLRIISVNKESELVVTCSDPHEGHPEETRQNVILHDLDSVEVYGLENYSRTVKMSDDMIITMKAPTLDIIKKIRVPNENDTESYYNDVVHNIVILMDKICTKDEVINASDCSVQDLAQWMDALTEPQFTKLYDHFMSIPHCRIKLDWTCQFCGKRNIQYLEGLSYFF